MPPPTKSEKSRRRGETQLVEEVDRTLTDLPRFVPARRDGLPVPYVRTLLIMYRLE